jgi:hypothetical protein
MSSFSPGVANDCFGAALRKLFDDPKYQAILKDLSRCSHLLTVIDSGAPGASETLLEAILAVVLPPV